MDSPFMMPIVMFIVIGFIAYSWFRYRHESRAAFQETIRKAIDQGQELSPELIERLSEPKPPEHVDLRRGIIAIAISIGVAALASPALDIAGGTTTWGPALALAALPFCVGIAYIVLWKVAPQS